MNKKNSKIIPKRSQDPEDQEKNKPKKPKN
jgi:hypothetical protein